jgi:RNA polymerase sigma factor (sigma-70 family)
MLAPRAVATPLAAAVDTTRRWSENRPAVIHPQNLVPELTLEACLPTVNRAVKFVARRSYLSDAETDELRSELYVRLLEKNGLARFEGRSELFSYLVTVTSNLHRDLRDKAWQKWRPSIEAKRQGPVAELLDRLLTREGHAFDEACEILRTNHRVTLGDAALAELRDRIPDRTRRRMVGEEAIASLPASGAEADLEVLHTEQERVATRLGAALERALAALGDEDQLILKMKFYDGLKVSEIAPLLGLEQKGLYPRLKRLLGQLRATLMAGGFGEAEVLAVLEESPVDIAPVLDTAAKPRDPEES